MPYILTFVNLTIPAEILTYICRIILFIIFYIMAEISFMLANVKSDEYNPSNNVGEFSQDSVDIWFYLLTLPGPTFIGLLFRLYPS